METYVPPPSGGGILGGKGVDGELDGIQAWKKGLKEKERKDKEPDSSPDATTKPPTNPSESSLPAAPEGQLDEIQLFKLMMKREAEKKDSPDQPVNGGTGATVVASSGVAASENSSSGSVAQPKPGPATNGQFSAIVLCNILLSNGLKTYQETTLQVIYLEDAQQLQIASNQMQHPLRLLNTHSTRAPRQPFHLRIRGPFFPSSHQELQILLLHLQIFRNHLGNPRLSQGTECSPPCLASFQPLLGSHLRTLKEQSVRSLTHPRPQHHSILLLDHDY